MAIPSNMKKSPMLFSFISRLVRRAGQSALPLFLGFGFFSAQPVRRGEAAPADPGGTLIHPRYEHTATLLDDGRDLLAGGIADASFSITGACEIYNPATNSWNATGSLNQARAFHKSLLLVNGRVLAMGGEAFGANIISSAEIYTPQRAPGPSPPA